MNGSIGILYESNEWSDWKLRDECAALGHRVRMIDAGGDAAGDEALECALLVSRVFASAWSRGHDGILERMPQLLARIDAVGIPLINPSRAHAFETSKTLAAKTLADQGIPAPHVFGVVPLHELAVLPVRFPCVVKPDCGGRGTHTAIVANARELATFTAEHSDDLTYVVEEYCEPAFGYLTRIEIIGGECALVVKRSIAENGLSGYHWGSHYAPYPDCPSAITAAACEAAACLGFEVGSFDVVETADGFSFIDCNSVSNVSEDNTEILAMDLMREYARYIDRRYKELVA